MVDEHNTCLVYDINTKELLFQVNIFLYFMKKEIELPWLVVSLSDKCDGLRFCHRRQISL